jgi:hypothetical protein
VYQQYHVGVQPLAHIEKIAILHIYPKLLGGESLESVVRLDAAGGNS